MNVSTKKKIIYNRHMLITCCGYDRVTMWTVPFVLNNKADNCLPAVEVLFSRARFSSFLPCSGVYKRRHGQLESVLISTAIRTEAKYKHTRTWNLYIVLTTNSVLVTIWYVSVMQYLQSCLEFHCNVILHYTRHYVHYLHKSTIKTCW